MRKDNNAVEPLNDIHRIDLIGFNKLPSTSRRNLIYVGESNGRNSFRIYLPFYNEIEQFVLNYFV